MGTREEEPIRTATSGEKPTSTRTCSTCNLSVPNTVDVCPNDGTRLTAGVREGDKLLGKYTFLEVIGEGGMSVVYKARHPDLNKILAVKMLHNHLLNGQQAAGRFWQEAKAASALSHRNVITVHDYGTTAEGQQFMVMDFLDGTDLSKSIKAKGPLPLAEAVEVFIQICDGLQHAHMHGVVHRDLKPSNIVLTRGDEGQTVPKIVDFGIAKVIAEGDDQNSHGYTKTGELLGSPPYMSPEQCKGTGLDARSDIYSIGCLMFEALTGKPPFDGSNFMEILFKHINDPPPTLKAANPALNFPPKLEAILARCLAKSRADRYQTAAELRSDLHKLQTAINNGSAFNESSISKKAILIAATICGVVAIGAAVFLNSSPKPVPTPQQAVVSVPEPAAQDDEGQPADALTALAVEQSPNVTDFNCNTPAYSDKSLVHLAKLKKLETLSLENSRVSTQGLKALSKSTSPIRTINLDKTYTRSEGLKYLTKFPIEKLDIQDTLVDDSAGKYVAQMKRLGDLQIARVNVSDAFVAALVGLKFLNTVDFDQTKITNKSMQYFAKIPSMKDLDVCRTEVNDKGLEVLAPLQDLEQLHLKNCVLGSGALKKLPTLPRLVTLDVNDTGLNDDDIAQLARFKKLQKLDLQGNLVSDASIPTLANLPDLRELHLSRTLVTPRGLKKLAESKSLEKLYIGGLQLTQSERDALKSAMPHVKLESTM